MLFHSWQFIFVFLPVTFFVYFSLSRIRLILAAKVWLVSASLFFYAYWNLNYLGLILVSLLFNFVVGTSLTQSHQAQGYNTQPRKVDANRQVILAVGIIANLGLLGYFKYTDFFIENINSLLGSGYQLPNILLPLAISFFTFQQIAYLADSYRGKTSEYNLLNYSIFVTFFPQLIAGPIVHHHEMMGQFNSPRTGFIRHSNIVKGLYIFSIGLFKKVVIADTFAIWADQGFDGDQPMDFFAAWATSLSYTFQLYFDFSGYCDMAIGIALLFNIKLPINFNSPYKALNVQDFWRRWHITLSRFLRDYIYIPLGGNRKNEWRIHINLLATFILGGLWHGASWMFVFWGFLHGAALVIHRLWQKSGMRIHAAIAWVITFLFVNFAWVFFRAVTLEDATRVLSGMINIGSIKGDPQTFIPTESLAWGGWLVDKLLVLLPDFLVAQLMTYIAIMMCFILIFCKNSVQLTMAAHSPVKVASAAILFIVATYSMLAATSTVFLYFNF